jgi:hypothetical protein
MDLQGPRNSESAMHVQNKSLDARNNMTIEL